jgi:hypothetical protein
MRDAAQPSGTITTYRDIIMATATNSHSSAQHPLNQVATLEWMSFGAVRLAFILVCNIVRRQISNVLLAANCNDVVRADPDTSSIFTHMVKLFAFRNRTKLKNERCDVGITVTIFQFEPSVARATDEGVEIPTSGDWINHNFFFKTLCRCFSEPCTSFAGAHFSIVARSVSFVF